MFKLLKHHPHFFFSHEEKKKIFEAIRDLEKETSAELRVHVGHYKKNSEIISDAKKVFEKQKMTKTEERNGVLIFICPQTKQFAVLGDTGIHQKVPEGFWQEISRGMEVHFKKNYFADGIVEAILKIGEKLKMYFPRRPDDRNELPNQISQS